NITNAPGNFIVSAQSPNVISGNKLCGVLIDGPVSTGNLVQGNFIGISPGPESAPVPNGVSDQPSDPRDGILIRNASANTIGGTTPNQGNIISGNGPNVGVLANVLVGNGVEITTTDGGTASKNKIFGNYIGTDLGGVEQRGNGAWGVLINGATDTM